MHNKGKGTVFIDFEDIFKDRAKEYFGIELSESQVEMFFNYGELLLEWNSKINLTTITDPEEIVTKHFLDSLVFVKWIRHLYSSSRVSLADLGTGAGFPGIPIKIIEPGVRVVLIDSLAKRLSFLQEVINNLELKDIETYHSRAEDIGRDTKFRETFEITTARAVAELPVLLEYTSPLLKVGGRLLAAKGLDPEREIKSAEKALQVLNCEYEHLDKYSLGNGADYRSLIIIKKMSRTPSGYPRQPGKPKKSPL